MKGAVQEFYNLLTAPRTAPTRTQTGHNHLQITHNKSGAYDVQHAECHIVPRDSLAVMFDRVEIAFILTSFHWLKSLTDAGGEETRVSGVNLLRRASENTTCQIIQAPS